MGKEINKLGFNHSLARMITEVNEDDYKFELSDLPEPIYFGPKLYQRGMIFPVELLEKCVELGATQADLVAVSGRNKFLIQAGLRVYPDLYELMKKNGEIRQNIMFTGDTARTKALAIEARLACLKVFNDYARIKYREARD